MNNLLNYISIYLDAPKPWGMYFQDSASPQMEALVELHDNIMFYLVIILFAVAWILTSIIRNCVRNKISLLGSTPPAPAHFVNKPLHSLLGFKEAAVASAVSSAFFASYLIIAYLIYLIPLIPEVLVEIPVSSFDIPVYDVSLYEFNIKDDDLYARLAGSGDYFKRVTSEGANLFIQDSKTTIHDLKSQISSMQKP